MRQPKMKPSNPYLKRMPSCFITFDVSLSPYVAKLIHTGNKILSVVINKMSQPQSSSHGPIKLIPHQ